MCSRVLVLKLYLLPYVALIYNCPLHPLIEPSWTCDCFYFVYRSIPYQGLHPHVVAYNVTRVGLRPDAWWATNTHQKDGELRILPWLLSLASRLKKLICSDAIIKNYEIKTRWLGNRIFAPLWTVKIRQGNLNMKFQYFLIVVEINTTTVWESMLYSWLFLIK